MAPRSPCALSSPLRRGFFHASSACALLGILAGGLLSSCAGSGSRKLSPAAYARVGRSIDDIEREVEQYRSEARRSAQNAGQRDEVKLRRQIEHLESLAASPDPDAELRSILGVAPTTDEQRECKECVAEVSRTQVTAGGGSEQVVDRTVLASKLDEKRGQAIEAAKARAADEKAAGLAKVADELRSAKASGATVFTKAEPFFSFSPLVAFRGGLDSTAIPAVAINAQPFELFDNNAFDQLGIQAVFGGALNPQDDGSGPGAAAGAGLWYPIGAAGTISIGYVLWREDSDTVSGVYIGLNLGQERTTDDSN